MSFFGLGRTEQTPENNYPEVITQVHREFQTAADKMYQEAIEILTAIGPIPDDKARRLEALGFKQVRQVIEVKEKEVKASLSKETIALVDHYRKEYPMYKFITLEQVNKICEKYGLVHGDVGRFKGFVPEKNLQEIEQFNKKYPVGWKGTLVPYLGELRVEPFMVDLDDCTLYTPDKPLYTGYAHIMKQGKVHLQCSIEEYDGIHFYGHVTTEDGVKVSGRFTRASLEIAAPVADFDMTGMTVKNYKIEKLPVQDPVVLHPVKGGYIIVTAWGDEASDPAVVNPLNN